MKESVDKLFREKLQTLHAVPSNGAWDRVQMQLVTKKSSIRWFYIAASIAAIFTASVFWVAQNHNIGAESKTQLVAELIKPEQNVMQIQGLNENEIEIETTDMNNQELVATKPAVVAGLSPQNQLAQPPFEFEPSIKLDPISSLQELQPNIQISFASMQLDFYPMYVGKVVADDSRIKRALQFANQVKNGEKSLFNLKKAKQDLFAFAKTKLKSEENNQENFD